MHIALLSPGWPLEKHQNGIVTYVHWTKLELERLGHRVSVLCRDLDLSRNEARVFPVRRSAWGSLVRRHAKRFFPFERDVFTQGVALAANFLEVHRRDPIDIIEMEESFGWFADVRRLTSLPILVKLHGPAFISMIEEELVTPFGRKRVDREGNALASIDAIASPAKSTLTQTLERYHLKPRIGAHIANPVMLDEGTPLWRLEDCGKATILFVGRFDKRKGGDIILQAFELMLRQRPDLKLVFVGPDYGLLETDGGRVHFEQFCDSLFPAGLRDRVDYRGSMANREVARLRVQALVTVVSSRWENAGYTSLEAMLQGCPVVSSDAGGCPEIVTHGETGRLAQSENPAAFAEQLMLMVDDPHRAAEMGAAGRRFVLEVHSPAKIARDSLALYARVIAARST